MQLGTLALQGSARSTVGDVRHGLTRRVGEEPAVPFQPPVASLTYTRADGSTSTFRVMPYLSDPDYWGRPYAALADAVDAAMWKSRYWDGRVTFGVVQAAEGRFLIRPMESERGLAFVLDPDLLPIIDAVKVTSSAIAPELRTIVGRDHQLDFSDPAHRTDVAPTRLPAG